MTDLLLAGFADPVRDSQAVFRAVMEAVARPGRVQVVAGPPIAPAPLDRATAAVLLTLTDAETPLWLDKPASAAAAWVAFHCGAPNVAAEAAHFAVVVTDGADAAMGRFAVGTDEAPEESATVILQVSGFGSGETVRLRGPGLAGEETLAVAGLPAGFRAAWAANRRLFPRGADVILCAGDRLAALPRTVEVR